MKNKYAVIIDNDIENMGCVTSWNYQEIMEKLIELEGVSCIKSSSNAKKYSINYPYKSCGQEDWRRGSFFNLIEWKTKQFRVVRLK